MSGAPAEMFENGTAEQPRDNRNSSDHPDFREFLDHVAELIAHDYVQRMRDTADPKDLEAWEKGGE